MAGISIQNGVPISLANVREGRITLSDELKGEMLTRERDFLRRKFEYDSEDQLAYQNAKGVHTAFRMNGELVGTINESGGFTGTRISDGGAFQRAVAYAEKTGLRGDAFADYASEKVSQALKERYGASLEIVTYDEGNRPTVGEMHAEMFGSEPSAPSAPEINDSELAWMKVFAQLYAQHFDEDPFAGLDVPYDDM